jgi:hypothetical protein
MAKRRSEGEMISKRQIAEGLYNSVYDVEGNKLGEIRHVFLDDASGEPEWVGVETGLFGAGESLVPARGASLVEDHLEVPYARTTVDDAPHVEVDAGGFLAVDEEHRLYEHYRIAWDGRRGWQQVVKRPDRGGRAPADLRTASDATQGRRFGPRPQRRRESRRRLPADFRRMILLPRGGGLRFMTRPISSAGPARNCREGVAHYVSLRSGEAVQHLIEACEESAGESVPNPNTGWHSAPPSTVCRCP